MAPKNRPEKICKICLRPFQWRKKWERDWDRVLYCSKACRDGRYVPKVKQQSIG